MVIGDGIPGDKKTAELCARCCNIAYEQALDDVVELLESRGLDVSKALEELIMPNEKRMHPLPGAEVSNTNQHTNHE